MKALFIGGTGTISTDITNLCVAQGWDLTVLNRGNTQIPNVSQWTYDINDEAAVKARLADEYFDVVVNFINFVPSQIERDIRLFAGKTDQYIFISSASAYQKPPNNLPITESTPLYNKFWDYSRNKIACEERLIDEYRKNAMPITIIRPSHTYNNTNVPLYLHGKKGSWSTLKRMLDGKPVLMCGDGATLWTLTHSEDFARAFVGIMGNSHAIGEAIHITTDEALTWNRIYSIIAHELGVTPKIHYIPSDFIISLSPEHEGPLLGDKANNAIFDNSKIKKFVPTFTAKIRFEQGIKAPIKRFLDNPSLQQPDPDFENFTDVIIETQTAALTEARAKLKL
ncbi:MAG: SDR family oxidoreductase [Turicibacter sp.]|nr:SDR family oxidoreductase [Turicibacter sp.]